MKKIIGILTIFFSFMTLPMIACNEKEMTDNRDGHVYKTVKIGKQLWLAENLAYKSEGSYPPNGDDNNVSTYGRLYTWKAAKMVCPIGWHLPTKEDFKELLSITVAGDDSSSIRDKSWSSGSNSSGFGALPAGYRWHGGHFFNFGSSANSDAHFWSSTPNGDNYAYLLYVDSSRAVVDYYYFDYAYSVRCIKDSN